MSWREALFCLAVALAVMGSHGSAQVPEVNEAYVVAYVDIMPSQRTAMLTALQRYRDASRKENGSPQIDALEQAGRPAHFAIVERWSDQAALDGHRQMAHATEFRKAVQSIRVSGYDERPYKSLSTATRSGAGSSGSVYVVSHVDIGTATGRDAAPQLLQRLAEESRREPGCLGFDVLQHTMRANHFTVFEVWRDQSALDAHVAAAHTRAYRDTVQPISGSPVDERVYAAVE